MYIAQYISSVAVYGSTIVQVKVAILEYITFVQVRSTCLVHNCQGDCDEALNWIRSMEGESLHCQVVNGP
jgi:hypothetical protein